MGGGVGEDKSRKRGGCGPGGKGPSSQPAAPGNGRARSIPVGSSMGKGGNQGEGASEREAPMPTFSWEEIQKHNLRTDKWLVIDRKVYNVTKWSTRHPGGHRVIAHYAGEDATVRVWGLQLPFSATGGIGSPGLLGAKQTSGSDSSSGRPGGQESESTAPIPRPESSSSGPAGPTWGGGRSLDPGG